MLHRIFIGVAILLAVATTVILVVDWNDLARSYVQRALEARTGREVRLEGVRLRPGLSFRIGLVGLAIANPPWAQHQPLVGLRSAHLTIRVWPLIARREIVLPEVRLEKPVANLEQKGAMRSWAFDPQKPRGDGTVPDLPQIGALRVDEAVIRYLDPGSDTGLTVSASHAVQDDGSAGLHFRASGHYRKEAVEIDGRGASLLTLVDQGDPYPLKVEATVGKTKARFDGAVVNPAKLERVEGDFAIEGDNLERLYRIVGVTLPATPPYRLAGRLTGQGATWKLDGFEGGMGDSDVAGDFAIDLGPEPPVLRARLVSKLLDLDDLGPLIGAPPRTSPGETASAQQKKQARRLERKREVVPDEGFKTERWGRLDAQVSLEAARIRRQDWLPIDKLSVRMTMKDKVIVLAPLRFGVASGIVDTTLRLDGRKQPLAVALETRFSNLQLDRMMPKTQGGRNSIGSLFGDAQLTASGASVKRMTESLDGRVHLTMGSGRVSELVFEALGLDAAEVVKIFATGDGTVSMRCMVVNLRVDNGVAHSDALVVATGDANVMGTGAIDLGRERLDLTLYTAPKDMSPLSLRAPLHLTGSFKDPQVRPDAGVLAAKAGAAVLLGLINPVLALVPLIETGPGTQSTCGELIQQAKGWREAEDPTARAVKRAEQKKSRQAGTAEQAPPEMPRAEEILRPGQAERSGGRGAGTREPEDVPRAEDVLEKDAGGG